MWTFAVARAAQAWRACARPISPPSTAAALFDMFCGLNGRTLETLPREVTAEARYEERLADVRAGALDHHRGDARHASVNPSGGRGLISVGQPATTRITASQTAAISWLRRPCASRKARPRGVEGTMPDRPRSIRG